MIATAIPLALLIIASALATAFALLALIVMAIRGLLSTAAPEVTIRGPVARPRPEFLKLGDEFDEPHTSRGLD